MQQGAALEHLVDYLEPASNNIPQLIIYKNILYNMVKQSNSLPIDFTESECEFVSIFSINRHCFSRYAIFSIHDLTLSMDRQLLVLVTSSVQLKFLSIIKLLPKFFT